MLLVAGLVFSATTAPRSDPHPPWILPGESIVVLESPQFHFDWEHRRLPLHIDLFRCATAALHAKYPQVRLVPQAEFVKRVFPDLEPGIAPTSPESLKLLADNDTWKERSAPLNVRYFVYGATENDIETLFEMFGCVGAATGGLCGGGAEWKKQSTYQALVVDNKKRRDAAVAGTASGTSWNAIVLPLFVGWKSPTEGQVCRALGRDVLALLERMNTQDAAAAGADAP